MTRRERLERKLEKRREWAEGRDRKAADLQRQNDPYRGDIAFNTQPGHIPERARAIKRSERAAEHYGMARHHEEKAAGLERQLKRSIFSDDEDAPERLEARIADLERQRDRMKEVNAAWRKAGRPEPGNVAGIARFAELVLIEGEEAARIADRIANAYSWEKQPYPRWAVSNMTANIGRLRKRLEAVEAQRERATQAEDAGGVMIEHEGDYARITFAEKPERAVLNALKAAGFRWGGGSWTGRAANIPEEVRA